MNNALYFIVFLKLFPASSFAWDGYDYDSGNHIEVEKGNLVREGEDIEIYDYGSGEYKGVTVESIDSYGASTKLEVYDYNMGEYRTFEMDD